MANGKNLGQRVASIEAELAQVRTIINCPTVVLLASIQVNNPNLSGSAIDYPEDNHTIRFEAHNNGVLAAYQVGLSTITMGFKPSVSLQQVAVNFATIPALASGEKDGFDARVSGVGVLQTRFVLSAFHRDQRDAVGERSYPLTLSYFNIMGDRAELDYEMAIDTKRSSVICKFRGSRITPSSQVSSSLREYQDATHLGDCVTAVRAARERDAEDEKVAAGLSREASKIVDRDNQTAEAANIQDGQFFGKGDSYPIPAMGKRAARTAKRKPQKTKKAS